VTCPGEKTRRFLVKNAEIFQSGKKCKDFSKWSCCNGRPAQVKILEIFRRGEKHEDFSKG
jgi:hypothetical protein